MKTKILNLINKSETIAILPHISIDGDTLGSSFALCEYIKSLGKKVKIYVEEPLPKNLSFLNADTTYSFEGEGESLAIAVDCGDTGRIGKRIAVFENAENTICIDHHKTNKGYAQLNLVRDCAATGEIIFDLLGKENITKYMADCLLTAIVTDTGAFRYSNTTEQTHIIAAELLKLGADSEKVCEECYENRRLSAVQLEAWCVSNMKLCHGGKTAIVKVTQKTLDLFGAEDEDCAELSSLLRTIEGIEVAAVLRERKDKIKVSLRSRSVDSAKVCSEIGGGGHSKAAGATMQGDIDKCAQILEELIGRQWN